MDAFEAIRKRDLEALAALLTNDRTLASAQNADGASLLSYAAYNGSAEAISLIRDHLSVLSPHEAIIVGDEAALRAALEGGWDANTLAPDGFTPLALAAFFNHEPLFDLLLPLTTDVNAQATNAQKVGALHAATAISNARLVEKLLRAGAEPDRPQQGGFRPLHVAAAHGDAVICGLLVLFGASAELTEGAGRSAIEHARDNGHGWLADQLTAFA